MHTVMHTVFAKMQTLFVKRIFTDDMVLFIFYIHGHETPLFIATEQVAKNLLKSLEAALGEEE